MLIDSADFILCMYWYVSQNSPEFVRHKTQRGWSKLRMCFMGEAMLMGPSVGAMAAAGESLAVVQYFQLAQAVDFHQIKHTFPLREQTNNALKEGFSNYVWVP